MRGRDQRLRCCSLSFQSIISSVASSLHGKWILKRSSQVSCRELRGTVNTNSITVPLFVLLSGSGFCLVNGFLNARYLTLIASEQSLNNIQFLLGSALWLLGFYGNIWHDRRLLELKRKSGGVYVIPTGGLFEYVSGANFLCEIIEWFGYAVAANFSLPATGFFIMTALNIGPRAWHHHNYYLERFPEYPKSRKSLIPFVI